MILVTDHLGRRFFSYISTQSRGLIGSAPTFQVGLSLREVPSVLENKIEAICKMWTCSVFFDLDLFHLNNVTLNCGKNKMFELLCV